ncbi:MAG: J domain-containing protein [Ilumatobacteraceae bacterium]|jgi:molecular chaperone DnaJ|nr:J domain-containing protein [Ilumatobacteraceae bacterium]
MTIGAHYRRLGVAPDATAEQIRAAYREAARRHHPDARAARGSAGSDDEMAAVNEAWRVLSDPVARARYDADLGGGTDPARRDATSGSTHGVPTVQPRRDPFARYQNPPRFPWRFILLLIGAATVAILGVGALTDPAEPTPIDNVIRVGSCVSIDAVRLEVDEADCGGPYDGVVEQVVPFDATCPYDLMGYRDRQGMGVACVRVVPSTVVP